LVMLLTLFYLDAMLYYCLNLGIYHYYQGENAMDDKTTQRQQAVVLNFNVAYIQKFTRGFPNGVPMEATEMGMRVDFDGQEGDVYANIRDLNVIAGKPLFIAKLRSFDQQEFFHDEAVACGPNLYFGQYAVENILGLGVDGHPVYTGYNHIDVDYYALNHGIVEGCGPNGRIVPPCQQPHEDRAVECQSKEERVFDADIFMAEVDERDDNDLIKTVKITFKKEGEDTVETMVVRIGTDDNQLIAE